jgi:hypothetical protein
MLRLTGWAVQPCKHCGETHEYLTRPSRAGCQPVLFPPGFHAGGAHGVEVDVFSVGPGALTGVEEDDMAYRRLARRVADLAIRCERCGERFTDLDAYADHPCELHFR